MENILPDYRPKAIGLGAIAGMRAVMAPAVLSHYLHKYPALTLELSPFHYLQNEKVATSLKVLAGVELAGDKIPNGPDRISPPQLGVRVLSGALVGATLSEANAGNRIEGALLGSLAAAATAFAFFYLRRGLAQTTNLPDAVFGVLEDALALSAGVAIMKPKDLL